LENQGRACVLEVVLGPAALRDGVSSNSLSEITRSSRAGLGLNAVSESCCGDTGVAPIEGAPLSSLDQMPSGLGLHPEDGVVWLYGPISPHSMIPVLNEA
jgi:hypothetical protein